MRYLLLLLSFLALSESVYSQTETETEYLDIKLRKLPGKEGAVYYKTTQFDDKKKSSKTETTYFITGEKYTETKSIKIPDSGFLYQGLAQKWYKNGQLFYTTQYEKGKKEGEAIGYYPSGKLKRREFFVNDKLEKGELFNEDGTPATFYPHEEKAEFPGGYAALSTFLKRNMKYPPDALRNNQQGVVVVKMIIDETGKMADVEVVKKVYPALDAEALRVVQAMPNFKPAMEEGVAKEFTYTLPIRFGMTNSVINRPSMPGSRPSGMNGRF